MIKATIYLFTLLFTLQSYQAWSSEVKPVERIISLSPHITELVFSAGAGNKLVGVSDYSNYPAQASQVPVVGSYQSVNIESIIALNPDLIITWKSATRPQDIEKLQSLGFNLWQTEIEQLQDITQLIVQIGDKAGTLKQAQQKADELNAILREQAKKYQTKASIRAFYQVWQQPLMTIIGKQFIS
ncbi:MAG: helical backbone metal receptor, partial [Thiomicrorhabdus sp.]|nr:helical backbone metal receptor [Thiomicrorhabdus sp.]